MSRLSGKVALISGAARGIGAETARALAGEGARVVIGDLREGEGRAVADAIGSEATFVSLDVTKTQDWDAAVSTTLATYGRLDVLVNNAGIIEFGPIDVMSHEQWHAVIDVDLHGVFNGIKAAIPALKEAGRGSIVNVSSVSGLHAYPAVSAYVAAKFGVRGLTKAAAVDLGKFGIRVNSVHPGWIETPMNAGAEFDTSGFPLGRPGNATEIAHLIVFLASDESSFSTGAEFIADGGETAGAAVRA